MKIGRLGRLLEGRKSVIKYCECNEQINSVESAPKNWKEGTYEKTVQKSLGGTIMGIVMEQIQGHYVPRVLCDVSKRPIVDSVAPAWSAKINRGGGAGLRAKRSADTQPEAAAAYGWLSKVTTKGKMK